MSENGKDAYENGYPRSATPRITIRAKGNPSIREQEIYALIVSEHGIPIREIAKRFKMSKSRVRAYVMILKKKGLIAYRVSKHPYSYTNPKRWISSDELSSNDKLVGLSD